VIVDPHRAPDQHQKLIISRGSSLVHAYHVWLTSVTAFNRGNRCLTDVRYLCHQIVSYPAHRQNDRPNDNTTPPALAEYRAMKYRGKPVSQILDIAAHH